MSPMSTVVTAPTIVVYAGTDRGDVATRVLSFGMLPVIVAEICHMCCAGSVTVEVDGNTVARGTWDDMGDIDEYLKALTA